jgi:hypothetical protein
LFVDQLPDDLATALASIEGESMGRTSYGEEALRQAPAD